MIELAKKDKKVARQIIDKGLQIELENGLIKADKILNDWKQVHDNRASYYAIYEHITDFDKHIARRYDGVSGSKYLYVILDQMVDGIITPDDLTEFSEDVQAHLIEYYKHRIS